MITINGITNGGKENFNIEQEEAVRSVAGTFMVAAPPGSGKTFVLQKRVLYMILKYQIHSENILAITFTNEAASEMRDRISAELSNFNIENEATISTFHSFALKMLKQYGEQAGFGRKFSLIDEDDKNKIIREVLLKLEIPKEQLNVKGAIASISKFKSSGIHCDEVEKTILERKEKILQYMEDEELLEKDGYDKFDLEELKEDLNEKISSYQIYKLYEFKKDTMNLYDFDDLIIRLRDMLKKRRIRKLITKRYLYVLCDEAQDVDPVQEEVLRLLTKNSGNLFCIYDDDQSIYGFRNADPNLIMNIDKKIQNSKLITLKENFRSTDNIIQASNHLINNNKYRIKKWMRTNNEIGEKVSYNCLQSKEAEADFVCSKIEELRAKFGFSYRDFAILYRNNDLNKTIEQKLISHEIPYQINKNISFFQRKEIKDMLAYLEFIVNSSDFHLERIINVPKRGVGEKALRDFKELSFQAGVPMFAILKTSTREQIKDFCEIVNQSRDMLTNNNKSLSDVIDFIMEETKYSEHIPEDEVFTRVQNIERLQQILNRLSEEYKDHEELLYQIKLMSDDDNSLNEFSEGKVNLMTMHSSKGRGFNVVFVIGCEQGIIPSFTAYESEQVEEERRIMYVAMTRAKKLCFISRAKYRVNINGGMTETKLSQFVYEIPEDLIEWNEANTF